MSARGPRVLREVGGLVIAEDGPRVLVVDRGNGPLAIAVFVTGIVAMVSGGFGALTLSAAAAGRGAGLPVVLSVAMLAVGVTAVAVAVAMVRRIRRSRFVSITDYRPVAVFDRAARIYFDGDGRAVAPLSAVTFHRRLQVGSSSRKLVVHTPTGEYVLLRGNPFTGGLADLADVLTGAVNGNTR